jgi:tripartite-type tricarboxylate transporter receptor subunit TctC
MQERVFVRALLVLAVLWPAAAFAQSYPTRPITLVAPYSAGSGIDILSRVVADRLSARLKQPVIVDDRPGAAGNLGAGYVAKAAPDGYTLLLTGNALSVAPALYAKLPFDPVKDFTHIAEVATGSMALVVNPKVLPVDNLAELKAAALKNPGKLNYSSAGIGTPHHLGMELFKRALGLDIVHVPYSGATGALNDLLAGHVPLAMFPVNVVLPYAKTGQLRVIAVSGSARSQLAPQSPTFEEAGLKDLDIGLYYFLSAPAKLSPAITAKLNSDVVAILNEPGLKDHLLELGLAPKSSTPEAVTALITNDIGRWKAFITAAHITAN